MKTILIGSTKGGTGKSTLSICLAQCAAHRGKKALVIDLDSQSDSSFMSGVVLNTKENTTGELMEQKKVVPQHSPQGYDMIPSRMNLTVVKTGIGSALRLSDALQQFDGQYDVIFLDAPPTTSEMLFNGLVAATDVLIPTKTSALELKDLKAMFELIKMFQSPYKNLNILGIVVNCYSSKTLFARRIFECTKQIADGAGVPILGTVRETTALRECCSMLMPLFSIKNKVVEDLLNIYDQLGI